MARPLVPRELRAIVAYLKAAGYSPERVEQATEGTVSAELAQRIFRRLKDRADA